MNLNSFSLVNCCAARAVESHPNPALRPLPSQRGSARGAAYQVAPPVKKQEPKLEFDAIIELPDDNLLPAHPMTPAPVLRPYAGRAANPAAGRLQSGRLPAVETRTPATGLSPLSRRPSTAELLLPSAVVSPPSSSRRPNPEILLPSAVASPPPPNRPPKAQFGLPLYCVRDRARPAQAASPSLPPLPMRPRPRVPPPPSSRADAPPVASAAQPPPPPPPPPSAADKAVAKRPVPKFLLPERTTSTSAITVPGASQSASNAQRTLSAVSYGRDVKIKPPDSEHTHTLAALSGAKSSVKVANGDVKERYRARDLTKGSHSAELIDSMVDNGLGTYISHGVDDLKIAGAHYQAVKAALIRALALSPLTMLIFPVFLFVTLGQHTGTVRSPLGAAPSRGLWPDSCLAFLPAQLKPEPSPPCPAATRISVRITGPKVCSASSGIRRHRAIGRWAGFATAALRSSDRTNERACRSVGCARPSHAACSPCWSSAPSF